MKNLFSVYNHTSIKKFINSRAIVIAGFMIFSTILLVLKFNEINEKSKKRQLIIKARPWGVYMNFIIIILNKTK